MCRLNKKSHPHHYHNHVQSKLPANLTLRPIFLFQAASCAPSPVSPATRLTTSSPRCCATCASSVARCRSSAVPTAITGRSARTTSGSTSSASTRPMFFSPLATNDYNAIINCSCIFFVSLGSKMYI